MRMCLCLFMIGKWCLSQICRKNLTLRKYGRFEEKENKMNTDAICTYSYQFIALRKKRKLSLIVWKFRIDEENEIFNFQFGIE